MVVCNLLIGRRVPWYIASILQVCFDWTGHTITVKCTHGLPSILQQRGTTIFSLSQTAEDSASTSQSLHTTTTTTTNHVIYTVHTLRSLQGQHQQHSHQSNATSPSRLVARAIAKTSCSISRVQTLHYTHCHTQAPACTSSLRTGTYIRHRRPGGRVDMYVRTRTRTRTQQRVQAGCGHVLTYVDYHYSGADW